MKPIGGYFELELARGKELHTSAVRLHTGRNCLEYILKAYKYKKILLPNYICEVVLEPISALGLEYEFYSIDENLNPIMPVGIDSATAFLYVNYFGIKQKTVVELSQKVKNLIVDNTQAFYAATPTNASSFNSARKFFGVADGAYLFCEARLSERFPVATSIDRMAHLVKRIETGPESGYADYLTNDSALQNLPIQMMSSLTHRILDSIDYEESRRVRVENFSYLQDQLGEMNHLTIDVDLANGVPMVYPLLTNSTSIRKTLIDNKIFVAKYWPNKEGWYKSSSYEVYLRDNLLAIPIDQRYSLEEMSYIVQVIKSNL